MKTFALTVDKGSKVDLPEKPFLTSDPSAGQPGSDVIFPEDEDHRGSGEDGGCRGGSSFSCACLAEVFRTFAVTAALWSSVAAIIWPNRLFELGLKLPELYLFALISLLAYAYELRSRWIFWTVALPGEGKAAQAFAARVQELRDAEPRLELCASDSGISPVTYQIAEWKDETREAVPDGFAGVPRGFFLVTFPLDFVPGDDSEASALEYAQERVALAVPDSNRQISASPADGDCSVAVVRMRLRWTDGTETGAPAPYVLADGDEVACLQPMLLFSVVCLFGLLADVVLRLMLSQLVWPVRKRFFTAKNLPLGVIRFVLDSHGAWLDGDEDQLRQANQHWLSAELWTLLWSEARQTAADIARLQRVRSVFCNGSGLAAACTVLLIIAALLLGFGSFARTAILLGASAVVLFSAVTCIAHQALAGKVGACRARLEDSLQGLAECSASWSEEDGPDALLLSIEHCPPKSTGTSLASSQLSRSRLRQNSESHSSKTPWSTRAPSSSALSTRAPSSNLRPHGGRQSSMGSVGSTQVPSSRSQLGTWLE